MAHSYLAFIDESGDDGLSKFRGLNAQGGASNWLVITAIVMRASHANEVVGWKKELLDRALVKKKNLHFKELSHSQKAIASEFLASKPIRCISIVSDKRTIKNNTYGKNMLYWYLSRYLIERLSWFCRDMRPNVREGDGKIKIQFARRGGMQYGDFQNYLMRLKNGDMDDGSQEKTQIHWSVIDIPAIIASDTSISASLQLSDICASSTAAFFEPDIYGRTEPTYISNLSKILYRRRNGETALSYGLKLLPSNIAPNITDTQKRNLEIICGRPPSS